MSVCRRASRVRHRLLKAADDLIDLAVAGLDSGTSVVDSVLALTGLNISSIENSLLSMYAAKGIDGGLALLNR